MTEQTDDQVREQLLEQLGQTNEHVFDPSTATPIAHRWIDRGLKLTCEDAGHQYHEVWKRMKQ